MQTSFNECIIFGVYMTVFKMLYIAKAPYYENKSDNIFTKFIYIFKGIESWEPYISGSKYAKKIKRQE